MYTAEEREQIIDIVDKMSLLRQDFDGAFTWIKENVSMPFDFDGEQQFISDLKQLVKINALKFGKIKQTLDNYVRNTNKKYKYNLVPDEILGDGLAKLIELNTQGKLGRHAQQIAYINHNLSLQRQKEQLEQANERLAKRAEKAQKLLDTELLKDSYIETLEMFSKFNSAKQYTMWDDLETPTKVIEFMEKNGVKQGKWLRPEGVDAWFKERIIWFKNKLKEK